MSYRNWTISTFTYPSPVYNVASELAALDIDGDHDVDLIAFVFGGQTGLPIRVLVNNGNGQFSDKTSTVFPVVPKSIHPRDVVIADFNGDGRPDVFMADHGYDFPPQPGARNHLYLSSGPHGFINASNRLPAISDYTHSAMAGDVDDDGDLDIYVGNTDNPDPYLLINDGTAHFTQNTSWLQTPEAGKTFTTGVFFDASGDGIVDMFLGSLGAGAGESRLLINPGDGDFSGVTPILVPQGPYSGGRNTALDADPVDLNRDGRIDLVVTLTREYQTHYIQMLVNYGEGQFVDETAARIVQATPAGPWATYTHVVDLNNDGFFDLVMSNGAMRPVFLNDGTGHFVNLPANFLEAARDMVGFGNPPTAIFDANGDGRMDYAAMLVVRVNNKVIFHLSTQKAMPLNQTGTFAGEARLGDNRANTLSGLGGADIVFGSRGNDHVVGGEGADYLNGGIGNDTFVGGGGGDRLVGGLGRDLLTGALGPDRFMFNAANESAVGANRDVVRDFRRAQGDKIQLSDIDADETVAGNQAFAFIGAQSFADYNTAHPGVLGMIRVAGTILQGNVNADLGTDFEIKVNGVASLLASDCIL